MTKNEIFMKDVIKYHPDFINNKELKIIGMKNPNMFNLPLLVEESIVHIGELEHVINGNHADFSDGSDCKTSSIRRNLHRPCKDSYQGEITGVASQSGTLKSGALRICIFNPHKDTILYYFLPKSFWQSLIHGRKGINSIDYSYSLKKDTIKKFKHYQVTTFEELALKKETQNERIFVNSRGGCKQNRASTKRPPHVANTLQDFIS